jgi:hypothetical protein
VDIAFSLTNFPPASSEAVLTVLPFTSSPAFVFPERLPIPRAPKDGTVPKKGEGHRVSVSLCNIPSGLGGCEDLVCDLGGDTTPLGAISFHYDISMIHSMNNIAQILLIHNYCCPFLDAWGK